MKYTPSSIIKMIKENSSKNEFKPVLGRDVKSGNEKNNKEAISQIKKDTGNYDGGKTYKAPSTKNTNADNWSNALLSDMEYESINPDFKKKVQSQLKGYSSYEDEKMHKGDPYGNAEYGSKNYFDVAKKHADKRKKERELTKQIGLTSREIDKNKFSKIRQNAMGESSVKRLRFKCSFLNEQDMLSKIPEAYKKDGKKFFMNDIKGNEYIVEWHEYEDPYVHKSERKTINEEFSRIKELYSYNPSDKFKNNKKSSGLDNESSSILNTIRSI